MHPCAGQFCSILVAGCIASVTALPQNKIEWHGVVSPDADSVFGKLMRKGYRSQDVRQVEIDFTGAPLPEQTQLPSPRTDILEDIGGHHVGLSQDEKLLSNQEFSASLLLLGFGFSLARPQEIGVEPKLDAHMLLYLWPLLAVSIGVSAATAIYLWSKRPQELAQEDSLPPSPGTVTSLFQIWGITSLNFSFGLMVGTMALFMLPKEAQHFFPQRSSLGVGILEVLIGTSMLVGPVVGRLSDSFRHVFGRRRPVILVAINLVVVSTIGCWISSLLVWPALFLVCVFCQQVMWNAANAAQTALLSDLVRTDYQGIASSFQVLCVLLGSMLGTLCVEAFEKQGIPHTYNYASQVVACWLLLPVVSLAATEARSDHLLLPSGLEPSLNGVTSIFWFRHAASPDFECLLKERCMYYVSTGSKAFILFFVRDVIGFSAPADQMALLAQGAIGTVVTASAGGVLASIIFSRTRIRPQAAACVGSLIMAAGTQFWTCCYFNDLEVRKRLFLFFLCVYGLGQGLYLSADTALTIATLPDPDQASTYLGLWGLSAFVGVCFSGLFMSVLMELSGQVIPTRYGFHVKPGTYHRYGYTVLLLCNFFCYIYIAVVCKNVRTRQEYEQDITSSSLESAKQSISGPEAEPSASSPAMTADRKGEAHENTDTLSS
eukprot:TRINITY_DN11340_c0_g1_i1.p1 TRINITY_DN11340_c0_g1~~TRINITY_DN11340_c0_g1_i1.p1  ORF type:complete len:660 (+),score=75.41 TRINITY_DN11340_c0_g1_i1:69-2048(+)